MRIQLPLISINGTITPYQSAMVSPIGNGFADGNGIFTTLKVRNSIPLFLDKHYFRLQTSMKFLEYSCSYTFSRVEKYVKDIILANALSTGGIRISIIPVYNKESLIIINCTTILEDFQQVSVITVTDNRDANKFLKMIYRVPNLQAKQKAMQRNAQDALFVSGKYLNESTYANIFSISNTDAIITPPITGRGLNGITRQILMEQLSIQEQEISITSIKPMLLVSALSMRGVESIDGRVIKKSNVLTDTIRNALEVAEARYSAAYLDNNENIDHR